MYVTYAPEGGAEQRWEFDPKRVRASKAEMIEKRAGEPWDKWLMSVQSGSMRARRVLLWHLLTVDHPTMRAEDVPDFCAGELTVQYSTAELVAIRDRAQQANLPAEQRDAILAALDIEITQAMEREGTEAPGKAPSPNGASGTPGR